MAVPSKTAVTRLSRELLDLTRNPDANFTARPLEDDLFTWHFVLYSFPSDTPYCGGCYHGYLSLPQDYPLQPPSIFMCTPSGRFGTQEPLCFSMTAYHPEKWNPAWTIRGIILGFMSLWVDDDSKSKGSLQRPEEERRRLAQQSWEVNARSLQFRELFPELLNQATASKCPAEGSALLSENRQQPAPSTGSAAAAHAEATGSTRESAAATSARPPETGLDMGTSTQPPADARGTPCGPCCSAARRPALDNRLAVGVHQTGPDDGCRGQVGRRCVLSSTECLPTARSRSTPRERPNETEESFHSLESPHAEGLALGFLEEAGRGDGPAECWICRDAESREPLLQPCACRGSMSGVHASCIESWVRHHRQSLRRSEPPRCPVCQEPYVGQAEAPGIGGFLCHCLRALLRSCMYLALLCAYLWAADMLQKRPGAGWLQALELASVSTFAIIFSAKVLVLTASLPQFQPTGIRCLQRFVVTDTRSLQLHTAEVTVALFMTLRVAPLLFSLPLAGLVAVPLGRCLLLRHGPSRLFVKRCLTIAGVASATAGALYALKHFVPQVVHSAALVLGIIWLGVCLIALMVLVALSFHPLNAGPHLLVHNLVLVLHIVNPQAREALASILLAHSLLLSLALLEMACCRKLQWRPHFAWVLPSYGALMIWAVCNFPRVDNLDVKLCRQRDMVFVVSSVWAVLLAAMALAVNWDVLARQPFQAWQRRHLAFRLSREHAASAEGNAHEPLSCAEP